MWLAAGLGWWVSRVVLFVIFFLVLTPVALLARLLGKRFLDLGRGGQAKSYWVARDRGRPSKYDRMS
jgi:hypothetical protein